MDGYRSSSAPDPSMNANPGLLRQLQTHTTAAPQGSRRHGRSRVSTFAETGPGPDPSSSMTETLHGRNIRFGRHPVIPPIGQRIQQQRNDGRNLERPHEATTTRRAFQPERPAVQYTNPEAFHPKSRLPHRHDDREDQTTSMRPVGRTHAQGGHNTGLSNAHYPTPVLVNTLPLPTGHGVQTLPPAAMHASYLPFHPMSTAYPMFPQVPSFYPPLTMPFLNPYNTHMTLATNPLHYVPPLVPYPVAVQQGPHQPDTLDSRLPEISELSPTDPNADYETGETQRQQEVYLYEDYNKQLVLDKLAEEICHELINGCLPDFTREVVNSCIDDIVRSYLLLGRTSARHHELKPLDSQFRKPVKQNPDTNNQSSPLLLSILGPGRGHPKSHSTPKPKVPRPRSNPMVTARRLGPLEQSLPMERSLEPLGETTALALNNPNVWRTQGKHNKVIHLKSNSELSHDLAVMVLNELLFCELLEAVCDGGLGMVVRTQAQHIINDLMFTTLLEQLFSEPQ